MSWAEAAPFPVAYHTSHLALKDRGQLRPGGWLLVHAGASGVGMAEIQLGRALGARVMATAGSDEKLDFARRQGAEHVLDYREETWIGAVKQITAGRGADIIFDPVGGDIFELSTTCIAPEGRLLVIGFNSGKIPSIAANRALLKNISVVGVFWGNHTKIHRNYVAMTQTALERLWYESKIRPEVAKTWPFAELSRDGCACRTESAWPRP